MTSNTDSVLLKGIEDMNRQPITKSLLFYVANQALSAIPQCQVALNDGNAAEKSKFYKIYDELPSLPDFVDLVVKRAKTTPGTLLGTLVLLDNTSKMLPSTARGRPCSPYRVFLASLILASKALNDVCPKNLSWARYARYFCLTDINLMEKQLLILLQYKIFMKLNDIIQAYNGFLLFDMNQILQQVEYSVNMATSSYYKPFQKQAFVTQTTDQQNTILSDDQIASYVIVYPDTTKNESIETISEAASSSSSISSNLCFTYSTDALVNDTLEHESASPACIE
ncbi:hypothetical protein RMATCC62417_05814 [Rhizopus microsporus]|nr:hypothetical protein RMATCC62417_05814 [Rhizopus microsporus]